jgi:hypothetical protein
MMTLSYLFTCILTKYNENTENDHLGDHIFQIDLMFACKNNKIYIPYLSYHDDYITKVYYNIDITTDNIYDFINTLINLYEVPIDSCLICAEIKDNVIKNINFTKESLIANLSDLIDEKKFDYLDLEPNNSIKFKQDYPIVGRFIK